MGTSTCSFQWIPVVLYNSYPHHAHGLKQYSSIRHL